MNPRRSKRGTFCVLACLAASAVGAHSASDAYLNLSTDAAGNGGRFKLHGQWDIAIRDLDFVLKLDDDGDGEVTWREVKEHRSAIERYAYSHLAFSGGAADSCAINPTRLLIDGHADGAYAALFFDVVCSRTPKTLRMDYKIFFAVDPSHRGIFVMHAGDNVSTALLSPQNARMELQVDPRS